MAEKKMSFIDGLYKELGESDLHQDVKDHLSVGFLPLNRALSGKYAGGLPVGRIIEIFGKESAGKTLMATQAIVQTQQKDGLGIYLDYEHAFSLSFGMKLGLKNGREQWIYKQPATAEAGFKAIDLIVQLARKEGVKRPITIIIDSVSAMVTEYEMGLGAGNSNMKSSLSLPAVMSLELKKLASLISETNATIVFLNQVRENPGVTFGNKEKTSGGNALKFYSSVRVQLRKNGMVKDGDGEGAPFIGEKVTATVIKNKIYEPFKAASYITSFAKGGIDLELSHLDAAIEAKLIPQNGAWYEWEGKKLQGKDKLLEIVSEPKGYEKLLGLFTDPAKPKSK